MLSRPLSYEQIRIIYDIEDSTGEVVRLKKEKCFVVKDNRMTTIVDRNFSSSGSIDIIDEGGTKSVYTFVNPPLRKGDEVTHCIEAIYRDSFKESKESVTDIVTGKINDLFMQVNFPVDRQPKKCQAYRVLSGDIKRLPGPDISDDTRSISLTIAKPPKGAKYVLEWEW